MRILEKELTRGMYLVSGETMLSLKRGRINTIGKDLEVNEKIFIPYGKRIPIDVVEDSVVEFQLTETFAIEKTEPSPVYRRYDELFKFIISNGLRTVLILGETDTGKTFLSLYLANKLIANNKTVAVLDMDTGQSDIGPPGTVGLAILNKQILSFSEVKPHALYFVGSHSPALHFLPYITGFVKLTNQALKLADVLIVDTPGWVHGDGGRVLRRTEIELLSPDLIVLLQRRGELEHLVKSCGAEKVFRIGCSEHIRARSSDDRKKLREQLSMSYFKDSKLISFNLDTVSTDRAFLLTGIEVQMEELFHICSDIIYAERLPAYEGILVVTNTELSMMDVEKIKRHFGVSKVHQIVKGDEAGVVVGLCDSQMNLLSLGIIREIDFTNRKITLLSPIDDSDISKIKILQFGSLKLTSDGKEAGFVEPGYF